MKFLLTILIPTLLLISAVFATENPIPPQEPADTIILISGRKLPALVQRVTTSQISFIEPSTNEMKDLDRRHIHRILYRTGQAETFNTLAAEMIDEGDWRTIILTENKSDVDGLYELGHIDAQSSPRSRDARSAQRSADIRLQKRAANMGGFMVYITRRESKGGFGEIPTHFVEGTVYGFEPPPE